MTSINSDEVQRGRGELSRDGVGRRPTPVTAAGSVPPDPAPLATTRATTVHETPASTTSGIRTTSPRLQRAPDGGCKGDDGAALAQREDCSALQNVGRSRRSDPLPDL